MNLYLNMKSFSHTVYLADDLVSFLKLSPDFLLFTKKETSRVLFLD